MTPNVSGVTPHKYTDNGWFDQCGRRASSTDVCSVEWLNGLVHLVATGAYERVFAENGQLRNLAHLKQDDAQWNEVMTKLNHEQELVADRTFLIARSCSFLIDWSSCCAR